MGGCIPGKTNIQIKKLNVNNNIENKNIKTIINNNSYNNIEVKENNNFFIDEENNFFQKKQKSEFINNNLSNNNLICSQPQMILVNKNKFIINTNTTNNTNDVSNENDEKLQKSIELKKSKKLSCNNLIKLKHNPTIFHENINNNLFEQKSLKTKGPILSKLEKYSKKIKKKEIN